MKWIFVPFKAVVNLTRQQVRSLFSIAMLSGIIALSVENWTLVSLAHHSIERGESMSTWIGLLIERLRYNSGLQAWFAGIMGLVVFGADFFKAKWGDREISAGAGHPDDADK